METYGNELELNGSESKKAVSQGKDNYKVAKTDDKKLAGWGSSCQLLELYILLVLNHRKSLQKICRNSQTIHRNLPPEERYPGVRDWAPGWR